MYQTTSYNLLLKYTRQKSRATVPYECVYCKFYFRYYSPTFFQENNTYFIHFVCSCNKFYHSLYLVKLTIFFLQRVEKLHFRSWNTISPQLINTESNGTGKVEVLHQLRRASTGRVCDNSILGQCQHRLWDRTEGSLNAGRSNMYSYLLLWALHLSFCHLGLLT